MKPIPGENAALLQLREIEGEQSQLNIVSKRFKVRKITVCDALGDPLPGNPKAVFKPYENKFIKIE
ncbi:MAG: hypothetical protein LBQ01_01660 [Prevotellaceae bacterium]|jgi:hypothetical protein|nr:hypothetical protein [Prevotellaceae bacterium]